MKYAAQLHINFTGGLVSPGELSEILSVLQDNLIKEVRFGLRQQMIIEAPANKLQAIEAVFNAKKISYQKGRITYPNIMSSYVSSNIFSGESWLREGVYKDVFNQFSYQPRLKINICDSTQHLVPFFTGHINWISSGGNHFWYLYIRLPKSGKTFCWPQLIYTNSIGEVSKNIEQFITSSKGAYEQDENAFFIELEQHLQQQSLSITKPYAEPLQLNDFYFPYYEGLNKEDNDTYWLGIYRRDEFYAVDFLKDICSLCLENKIGQLYTTPWKSIIIKGIQRNSTGAWNDVLGKYRVNDRHAANELNWQIEDAAEEGLIIKRSVINHFDKEDVRTSGLSFALQTKPSSILFGSVIIKKRERTGTGKSRLQERFDILYTKDFNPNSKELVLFRESVTKPQLGTYLVSLCKLYYEFTSAKTTIAVSPKTIVDTNISKQEKTVHQCPSCFTIYDERYGCSVNNIPENTPFEALPDSYVCPLCETPKEAFTAVVESMVFEK